MATRLNWRDLIASKKPLRALMESVTIGGILAFVLSRFYGQMSDPIYTDYFVTITVIAIALYAYRLHILPGGWEYRFLYDVIVGIYGGVFVGVAVLQIIHWVTPSAYNTPVWNHRPGIALIPFSARWEMNVVIAPLAFIIARTSKYVWRIWDDVRRRYFVYELVHWFLMFVLLAGVLACAGLTIATNAIGESVSFPAIVRRTGEIIIISDGLLVLLLIVLFFPLTLFPFFMARRITGRIKSLADATSVLRAGDFAVRATVRGADEVAQLQRAFNAMADDLEKERHTVTELLRLRQELFASVSHELRTPISIIKSHLESDQADLDIVRREVAHLERLINDVFTLARAEVAQLEFRLELVDAIPLLRAVVEASKPLAWSKNRVEIVAELPDALPPLRSDANRLEQIVVNLVDNAVKHTPPGGAVILSARMDGESILIQVRDTGSGIPPDDLPHIWQRFYAREGGTGLGLALVKELSEAMGGSVSVESDPGEGSCFSIRLG